MNESYEFVLRSYEAPEQATLAAKAIAGADIVIAGHAPWRMLEDRLRDGKPVFFYSERLFKKKSSYWQIPARFLRYRSRYAGHHNISLLAAGVYAASDYAICGAFRNRSFKFGYFPETRRYADTDALLERKLPFSMVWAGRFLDWKHPETVVTIIARLKKRGIPCILDMIGTGPMEAVLRKMAEAAGLNGSIRFLGAMPPESVRARMESARLFLFTSGRGEGWGAVLNEAMNSGCAVLASREAGASPYLVHDGVSGVLMPCCKPDFWAEKAAEILTDDALRIDLGREACRTITESWNADIAAERLLDLADSLAAGRASPFAEGICSPA